MTTSKTPRLRPLADYDDPKVEEMFRRFRGRLKKAVSDSPMAASQTAIAFYRENFSGHFHTGSWHDDIWPLMQSLASLSFGAGPEKITLGLAGTTVEGFKEGDSADLFSASLLRFYANDRLLSIAGETGQKTAGLRDMVSLLVIGTQCAEVLPPLAGSPSFVLEAAKELRESAHSDCYAFELNLETAAFAFLPTEADHRAGWKKFIHFGRLLTYYSKFSRSPLWKQMRLQVIEEEVEAASSPDVPPLV